MKLLHLYLSLLILLTCTFCIVGTTYAIETGPCIDDGMGNAVCPGVKKKSSSKTYEDIMNSLFGIPLVDNENIPKTPTITITPILQPITPLLTPGSSNTSQGQLADRIVQVVHANCNVGGRAGIVSKGNVNCLNNLNGVVNNLAIAEMRVSASLYQYLQCVGCARAMGKAVNIDYNGYGNAKQHAGQNVLRYTYYPNNIATHRENWANVVPGSMYIITTGAYGHIGFMTEVYRDTDGRPTSFKAFECNYGGNGYVRHDKIWPFSAITGWQKPNSS